MASENTGNRDGITTVDAQDLQELNRTGGDISDFVEEAEKSSDTTPTRSGEPEVVVEEEERAPARTESQSDDRLSAALSTIERLERENREYSERLTGLEMRTTPARSEPQVEFVEVFPGVKLPKNKEQWPIQLTKPMIESIGIDPSITDGLNVLANAFFVHVTNAVTEGTIGTIDARNQEESTLRSARSAFEIAYPDLRSHPDLLGVVERNMINRGIGRGMRASQYAAELAMRTRQRIAALRGISLEQYVAEIGRSTGEATAPARSRASMGGGTRSRGGTTRPRSSDNEMDELMKL